MFSSEIFPKYDCMTSMIFNKNSKTIAALTFCFVTAANQIFARFNPNKNNKLIKELKNRIATHLNMKEASTSNIGDW